MLEIWHCPECGECNRLKAWHCGRCETCREYDMVPCGGCGGVSKFFVNQMEQSGGGMGGGSDWS